MKHFYILLIACFWVTNTNYAQEVGKARIFVQPSNTIIKIGDELLDMAKLGQGHIVELPVGTHILQLWAEKMAIHTDTLTIVRDSLVNYRKGLNQIDPDYQAFREAHSQYFKYKMVNVGIVAADVGLTASFLLLLNSKKEIVEDKLAEVSSRQEAFQVAITSETINAARASHADAVAKYEDARKSYNSTLAIGVSGLAIAYAATSYLLIKRKKKPNPKPVYKAQNPFALQNFSIDTGLANFDGSGIHQLTFKLKF